MTRRCIWPLLLRTNELQDTPLFCALRHSKKAHLKDSVNFQKVLTYLIKKCKALDPNHFMITGYGATTPLYFAVALDAPIYVIKMLVQCDARKISHVVNMSDADESDPDFGGFIDDDTPLHAEIRGQCRLDVIKLLVNSCSQVLKKKTLDVRTPLHSALQCKRPLEIIEYLVRKDSSVLLVDTLPEDDDDDEVDGYIPLIYGIKYFAEVEVLKLLVDSDLKVLNYNWQGACGRTPLHYLLEVHYRKNKVSKSQEDAYVNKVMEFLLPYWTLVSQDMQLTLDSDGISTPLSIYLKDKFRCPGLLDYLIDTDEKVLCLKNLKAEYPFMRAVKKKLPYEIIVKLFPRKKQMQLLNLTDIGQHKGTFLHYIVEHCNDIRVFEMVINTGIIFLDFLDRRGMSALHIALTKIQDHDILKLLCDNLKYPMLKYTPMKITKYNRCTATPLHLALHGEYHSNVVRFLIDAKCHILQTTDESRRTPLHVSVRGINGISTHYLLLRGGQASGKQIECDIWGMTPLMYGICQKLPGAVLKLMIDTEHHVLSTVGCF